MADSGDSGIVVEKTLHKKDAFVLAMAYTSPTKPILRETVQEGLREFNGKKLIRVSRDNGKTWTVTGEDNWEEKRGDRTARRDAGNTHVDPNHGIMMRIGDLL